MWDPLSGLNVDHLMFLVKFRIIPDSLPEYELTFRPEGIKLKGWSLPFASDILPFSCGICLQTLKLERFVLRLNKPRFLKPSTCSVHYLVAPSNS